MFIHLGNKKLVSDTKTIGIFNVDTLKQSDLNEWILHEIDEKDKSVAIDEDNNVLSTRVSPFTVIKRTAITKDFVWRKKNE
ncbi:MAG: hypothetical protein CVV44_08925 [Spirochaetae bacterium HGW-Spirochaetae-1]|jgi:hypothetical protein|nr:MAG: hypothetical protein CVV44_08925 [Spirochaetae bacterium HGW-Spirochaetae-1]